MVRGPIDFYGTSLRAELAVRLQSEQRLGPDADRYLARSCVTRFGVRTRLGMGTAGLGISARRGARRGTRRWCLNPVSHQNCRTTALPHRRSAAMRLLRIRTVSRGIGCNAALAGSWRQA